MTFKARVSVTLRKSILDVQGKAVLQALRSLSYQSIKSARMGKHIELELDANSPEEAYQIVSAACQKLLANPVMEDFHIDIEPVAEQTSS
ncbi:MAG: phosphoribosylformylglycinamidine synthase subunit PurS [Chloroherpetonaceae bacterium]|nr:phosphoribosylformylglycinamidine synthase subunit PurS [Chloroherpetonaceae bacterium]